MLYNLTKKTFALSIVASAFIFTGCAVKPKMITPTELKSDVNESIATINALVVPIEKPISLDEAIDRAFKHNLEQKMNIMNSVLAEQKIDAATYEALPELSAKAGYSARDKYAASASTSFQDGEPQPLSDPISYSVSQDKQTNTAGASFSWNILDFGLSYVRANQQSNKYLISKENERKAKNNLAQSVREAYYRAVSADELLNKLEPIMQKTKQALQDSKDINKLKLDSPLKTLTYQRELLEIVRALNSLEESLSQSKTELAKLMGLKPGAKFELSEKIKTQYDLPKVNISVNDLEQIALENRPELQESRYQIRISEQELTAVKLKLLPGINVNAGYNYDDNKYLLNNEWMSYGANVSWNLFSVFSVNQNTKIAKTSLELAKLQKTALSVAVIGQVHLAMIDFAQAKKEYEVSEQYANVAKDIFNIIQSETNLNVNSKLSLIKEELNYLVSNLKLSSSYAKVQNAYGKLILSVGKPELFYEMQKAKEIKIEEPIDLQTYRPTTTTATTITEDVKEDTNTTTQNNQTKPEPEQAKLDEPQQAKLDEPQQPAKEEQTVNEVAIVKIEPIVAQPQQEEVKPEQKEPEVVTIKEEPKQEPVPEPIKQETTEESTPKKDSPIVLFETVANDNVTYVVTNEFSNIRKSPSMDAPIVRYTNKGEILKTSEFNNNWYKVDEKWYKVNGGYIHKNVVDLLPADYKPQTTTDIDANKTYATIKKDVNLREKPSNTAPIVKALVKGEMVEIIAKDKNWYQTNDGYIYKRYLKLLDK